ncbi:MAG: tyrosine-type recombinase/integrase, partial [Pseudomonadales bacterium]|nr:tyrosine-type recombinase/integrase [Pseudomonadales bacterium]
ATFKLYEGLGIRLRELHHCYRDGNYVIVPAEFSKSRRDRMIPIPESLISDFELASKNPFNPDSITHAFRRYANKAQIAPEKTLHSMRHTYALRKLIETNNIVFVKELLGHRDIETTMVYTKFPTEYLMKVLADSSPVVGVDPNTGGHA